VAAANTIGFDFHWGIRIPVRDGIHLNATVYTPRSCREPKPCVFMLTPYIADSHHERGVYFATQGIPFAIVDSRGRGNSEGKFQPLIQEANDGYDVVQWLARQPYCDGKVAMCGGSYLGYNQWATAKERPPNLATIVPCASPYLGVDFPMRNNIFNPYLIQWICYVSGRAAQRAIFADSAFWSKAFRQWYESGRPFREVDALLGSPSATFQEWLDHPGPDTFWDQYNPTEAQYAGIELPILTITGVYDDDQPGALEHYRQHLRNASPSARCRHYLIIGPWDHLGTGWAPCTEFGGLTLGHEGVLDMRQLHLDWYAWTMQSAARPSFLRRLVSYYVMGAERWRYADTLEAVTARYQTYYLDSATNANDVFSSGSLSTVLGKGQPDFFTYDPGELDAQVVNAEANAAVGLLTDQRVTLALRGRQLVYHSRPFEAVTEISGFFKLSAWIAIDCPDTDLYVTLYEIDSEGSSIRLSTDGIRARYRGGLRSAALIQTRNPLRYDFERFTFISRQIKRGHKLRLVIAPMGRLIDTTFAEKNYNAGGVVAEESDADARPVTVRLFHDEEHPSALHIPLGHPEMPRVPA
jgi:putative CocE/NonD family hydrolase